MAQHCFTSKYFADDKDIADILLQGRFTASVLMEYARSRGLFISSDLDKTEMVIALRGLLCSWTQVSDLVSTLDTQDRAPHFLPRIKEGTYSDDEITQAIEAIRDLHAGQKEQIVVKKTSDVLYTVEVSYEDTYYNRTRLLQKEPRVARIHIQRDAKQISLRIEDNAKAKSVASALTSALTKEGELPTKVIELSEIKQPRQRTAFFIELIRGIYGHTLTDVSDLNVEYMARAGAIEDSVEGGAEIPLTVVKKKTELKAKLKSAALSGSGLLFSREYQELVKSDFYLCRVVWTVDHDSSGGNRLALSAEFSEPDRGTGFRYAVVGKWERNSEGEFKKTRVRVEPAEGKRYEDAIEAAAFEAYDIITSPEFKLPGEEAEE